jgi:hypothetical protein
MINSIKTWLFTLIAKSNVPVHSDGCKVQPLPEGRVVKGGINGHSQITQRPPEPVILK